MGRQDNNSTAARAWLAFCLEAELTYMELGENNPAKSTACAEGDQHWKGTLGPLSGKAVGEVTQFAFG